MNTKRKGTRAEHRTIALLEASGYRCTRAAASLGTFDVVGVSATDILLVQVKAGREWPRADEMEAIKLFPAPSNARKILHRWRDRERLPDVREL